MNHIEQIIGKYLVTLDGAAAFTFTQTAGQSGSTSGDTLATTATPAPAPTDPPIEQLESTDGKKLSEGEMSGATTPAPTDVPINPPGKDSHLGLWIVLILLALVAVFAVLVLTKSPLLNKLFGKSSNAHAKTEPVDETGSTSRYCAGVAQIVGGRENQEDAYCISDWRNPAVVAQRGVLAVVADGVGGMNNGQVASGTAVRSMISWFERQDPSKPMDIRLLELAATAQRDVLTAQQHAGRCGSTLVSVLIHNGYMTILSIGDSRIALYRNGVLLPLNREHVNGKDIAETLSFGIAGGPVKGNPNAITSYLGKPDLRQIDRTITPMQLVSGDRILLMSDGVFGTLSDDEIISMLNMSPAQSAQAIVEAVAAKGKPHQDNATALVVAIN